MYNHFLKAKLIHNGFSYVTEDVLEVDPQGVVQALHDSKSLDKSINLDLIDGILCPGFVNVHCHTELSAMQGEIPEGTGLVNFVYAVWKHRDQASEIEKNLAISEAIEQMQANGIVAVGDICNTLDSMEVKKRSPLFFHNFFEASGFTPASLDSRFQSIVDLKNEANEQNIPNNVNSITPHSPYSTSPQLIKKIVDYNPQLISIHNQESQAENNLFEKKEGHLLEMYKQMEINIDFFEETKMDSLMSTLPYLSDAKKVIFVHNIYTSHKDIEAMHKTFSEDFALCLCPRSNLYIEDTLPDASFMFEHYTDQVCLGTDSLASNDQLSILAEMRCLLDNYSNIDLEYTLKLATINGARALGIDDRYGSFVKGKKPGVLAIMDETQVEVLY